METLRSANEPDTRQRLIDAACHLFAEKGFSNVSIRQICEEARANVAAVNYYFRDKEGLCRELLDHLIEVAWKPEHRKLRDAMEGKNPEEKLFLYVRKFIGNLLGEPEDESSELFSRLLSRAEAEQTPAFEVVIEKGWKPHFRLLCEIVGQLAGRPEYDPAVTACAMSAMGQCLIYEGAKKHAKQLAPGIHFTPEIIEGIARHVTQFSLAGIQNTRRNLSPESSAKRTRPGGTKAKARTDRQAAEGATIGREINRKRKARH
jgi:TetR/AcrR family transcriptional regulator, regulator of cefoperazone and chloramphenicol sensitivity